MQLSGTLKPRPKARHYDWAPKHSAAQKLLQSCIVILTINWVAQGMRGMQRKELTFRILLLVMLTLAIWLMLWSLNVSTQAALLLAFVVAHSLNYTFNGQFWVGARYCNFFIRDSRSLDKFLDHCKVTVRTNDDVSEAVCIGSQGVGAGTRSARSDIDLRLIFGDGLKNWFAINWLVLRLRSRAFCNRVPLDLYVYDSPQGLTRFRQDEPLLTLKDRNGKIQHQYYFRIQHSLQ